MWAIILTVMKILGLTVLGLIGLLLILLLIPVSYRGGLQVKEENLSGTIGFSWLFRFMNGKIIFGEETGTVFRIFFLIPVGKGGKKKTAEADGEPEETEVRKASGSGEVSHQAGKTISFEENSSATEENSEKEKASEEPEREPFIDRLIDLHGSLTEKLHGFFDLCIEKTEKADDTIHYLTRDDVSIAIKCLLGSALRIMKSYLPHKGRGYILFGLEDPAAVGKITGLWASAVPVHHAVFDFEPCFTEKKLEADLTLKGHVVLFVAVKEGIRCILNRNVRSFLKSIKNKRKHKEVS